MEGDKKCIVEGHFVLEGNDANQHRKKHHNGTECCDCKEPCLFNPGFTPVFRNGVHVGWKGPKKHDSTGNLIGYDKRLALPTPPSSP